MSMIITEGAKSMTFTEAVDRIEAEQALRHQLLFYRTSAFRILWRVEVIAVHDGHLWCRAREWRSADQRWIACRKPIFFTLTAADLSDHFDADAQ